MVVIGITGGIASGKSVVTRILQRLGAVVLDADRLGHEVLREPDVEKALRQRWGNEIFLAQGEVDRAAVAQRVFAPPPDGPRELDFLEQLTHPRIEARLADRLEYWARQPEVMAVVLDAPVLYKAGWDVYCDTIIYVDVPKSERLARAGERGWSEHELDSREARQASCEQKRQLADVIIDNSGTLEQTAEQMEKFWQSVIED